MKIQKIGKQPNQITISKNGLWIKEIKVTEKIKFKIIRYRISLIIFINKIVCYLMTIRILLLVNKVKRLRHHL